LIDKNDLIIDIGSNDGNLLSNFKNKMRVLGVTPEDVGKIAIKKGIPTILDYFDNSSVVKILTKYGKAKIITATNVFAHIDHPHKLVKNILKCLKKNGVFIAEVHYVSSLIKTLQYDTIYHEHMRYYSLYSLQELLGMHGLKIFDAEIIETHGGSLRIYASTKKNRITNRCQKILLSEKKTLTFKNITKFRIDVHRSKIKLLNLINSLKLKNKKIYAIGAPSRASTLVNFVGLDRYMIDCILERTGSYKINKLMPGTNIPVLNENIIKVKKPDYLLILSWHIYKELMDNFRSMNYSAIVGYKTIDSKEIYKKKKIKK
jgi:2-polyprenyl-3-methyl-5-hydroxy-6-metoxy-1,4-benzoquinol methylase